MYKIAAESSALVTPPTVPSAPNKDSCVCVCVCVFAERRSRRASAGKAQLLPSF